MSLSQGRRDLEISSRMVNQTWVIALKGSIDALTANEITSYTVEQFDDQGTQLVVDLSGVAFMSSAGLRAVLTVLKERRQRGGDLRLAAAQPGVEKVLKISGFTSIVKTYPTVESAVASFQE